MAIYPKFTSAELDRFNKRKSSSKQYTQPEQFQRLTPQQQKLIEDSELAKCSYREDKAIDCIVVWYDGFPLIEIPKSRFGSITDFRKIPEEAERIMKELKFNEDQNK